MKYCDTIEEAVKLTIEKLNNKISVLAPLGIGSGNQFLNSFAEYAKRGEIELSVFTALGIQIPELAGTKGKIANPIFKRVYENFTPFHYLDECVKAAKNGKPMPDYLKYNSFYFFPGFGVSVPEASRGYTPVNFRDTSDIVVLNKLNVIAMKASCNKGTYNCGTNVDVVTKAMDFIKKNHGIVMILETPHMPYCHGEADIPKKYIDYVVKCDEPLFNMPHQPLTVVEHAIGHYTAGLIPDGATLQLGIGQMADSIAFWLKQYGRTGLNGYSEMVSPGFKYLIDHGVITRRDRNKALVTGAFIVGNDELYKFVNKNRDIRMTSIHETNKKEIIETLPEFHAINSALQMDLFSQASSEGFFNGGRYVQYTGMGGQFEFQESGMQSKGGKSILCLRSANREDKGNPKMSGIVSVIKNAIGVPRNKMDYVVTEYGWRSLRYKTIEERAIAMVELADLKYQKDLVKSAKKMGLIRLSYTVPDECKNNTYASLVKKFGDIAGNNTYPMGTGIDIERYATRNEMALLKAVREGAGIVTKIKLLRAVQKERKK